MDLEGLEKALAAPALRALASIGINKITDFQNYRRVQIQELHGVGLSALLEIERIMCIKKLEYKDEEDNSEITAYIDKYEGIEKDMLTEVRQLIRNTIPKAKEKMAYGMPSYYYGEYVIHFAGFKNHIGIYPTPDVIDHFKEKLKKHQSSKGAIQFSIEKKIPKKLIKEIIEYRFKRVKGLGSSSKCNAVSFP